MAIDKKIDFGVKAFIVQEGKFLVMHNNGETKDLWELPGGRMEFGENVKPSCFLPIGLKIHNEVGRGSFVNLIKTIDIHRISRYYNT